MVPLLGANLHKAGALKPRPEAQSTLRHWVDGFSTEQGGRQGGGRLAPANRLLCLRYHDATRVRKPWRRSRLRRRHLNRNNAAVHAVRFFLSRNLSQARSLDQGVT